MELVIFLILILAIFVIIVIGAGKKAVDEEKEKNEQKKKRALKAIETSNSNLYRYIAFLQEHEPAYGRPKKVLGVQNIHFLQVYNDGEQAPNVTD
nr:hypothetical protein [Paludibacteraceae bacterium]